MEQEIKGYIDNYVQLIIENPLLATIVIFIAIKLFNDIKSLSKLSKSMPDRLEMINDVGKSVKLAIDEKLKTSLRGLKDTKNTSIEHRIALFLVFIHEIVSLPIVAAILISKISQEKKNQSG